MVKFLEIKCLSKSPTLSFSKLVCSEILEFVILDFLWDRRRRHLRINSVLLQPLIGSDKFFVTHCSKWESVYFCKIFHSSFFQNKKMYVSYHHPQVYVHKSKFDMITSNLPVSDWKCKWLCKPVLHWYIKYRLPSHPASCSPKLIYIWF